MSLDTAPQNRCTLQHRGFVALGSILFRRSGADNAPVMVLPLGGREASVPLRAVQRELAIEDDSEDGRMFGLIAGSLDFVAGLRPGDLLPTEVLTGEASWEPGPRHRRRALARLRLSMVAWLGAQTGDTSLAPASLTPERLEQDPDLRAALDAGLARAAQILDVPGGRVGAAALLERAGAELAYIEALREALLCRIQAMAATLEALGRGGWRGDATRLDWLNQAQRLSAIALRRIGGRFAEVDAQTGEVVATLGNIESQRVFIRSNRDWLHRSRLAWEPILRQWDAPHVRLDDAAWALIGRTYGFLAQRFMPVQEWQAFNATHGARLLGQPEPVLLW